MKYLLLNEFPVNLRKWFGMIVKFVTKIRSHFLFRSGGISRPAASRKDRIRRSYQPPGDPHRPLQGRILMAAKPSNPFARPSRRALLQAAAGAAALLGAAASAAAYARISCRRIRAVSCKTRSARRDIASCSYRRARTVEARR